MIKVEIELDEQKIREDNKYVPESIMDILDNAFASRNQPILEANGFSSVYRDSGDPERDFAVLGELVLNLAEKEWFLPYAKKIFWHNSEEGVNENDFETDDFLETIVSNNYGAAALCRS